MKTTRLARLYVAIGLGFGLVMSAPASARAWVGLSIGVAPPPAHIERVVTRAGYAWAPGYSRWNGARHVWVDGAWLTARPGQRYVPAAWVRVGPSWHFHRGYWR